MIAVAVSGEVDGSHPVPVGELGGHVRPPVRVCAPAVDEDQPGGAEPTPGEVVDRCAIDGDGPVLERCGQGALEPLRGLLERLQLHGGTLSGRSRRLGPASA